VEKSFEGFIDGDVGSGLHDSGIHAEMWDGIER
jgi:hypothetical protein